MGLVTLLGEMDSICQIKMRKLNESSPIFNHLINPFDISHSSLLKFNGIWFGKVEFHKEKIIFPQNNNNLLVNYVAL